MNEKMSTPLGSAFPKERIRYAMLSFFLAQGLCFSSWASRIPDVKDIFEVNYAFYWGLVLFLIPVGKFGDPVSGLFGIEVGESYYGASQCVRICLGLICDRYGT